MTECDGQGGEGVKKSEKVRTSFMDGQSLRAGVGNCFCQIQVKKANLLFAGQMWPADHMLTLLI